MGLSPLSEVLRERGKSIVADLDRRARGEVVHTHIPTGLPPLDRVFGGAERGVATLVLGHSGEGKTTLLETCEAGAAQAGFGVLAFHLEDPARRLADRVFARLTGEAAHRIGRLDVPVTFPDQMRGAVVASDEWTERIAMWAGDSTPSRILSTVRDTTHVGGVPVGLVVIDYLQRFSDTEESLEAICGNLARDLGQIAEERGLAVLLGSQVRSQVVERGRLRWDRHNQVDGFRPGRGDCMWSRRPEQFCRATWVWFRPDRWRREMGVLNVKDDRGELWVVKANYGPEGVETLGWDGAHGRIFPLGTK